MYTKTWFSYTNFLQKVYQLLGEEIKQSQGKKEKKKRKKRTNWMIKKLLNKLELGKMHDLSILGQHFLFRDLVLYIIHVKVRYKYVNFRYLMIVIYILTNLKLFPLERSITFYFFIFYCLFLYLIGFLATFYVSYVKLSTDI